MQKLSIGDIEMGVFVAGSGTPLVLVHGFPLDHTMWSGQLEPLPAVCQTIAPDLRGFGASGVTSGTLTMAQMADDLAHLLDRLKVREPIVLCGLSMGGYVSFAFLRKHASRVRALVLCDTRSTADTQQAADGRRQMAEKVLKEGSKVAAEAMLPKLLAPATLEHNTQLVAMLRETIERNDPRGIAAAQLGMAERPDVTSMLAEIKVPTLVVVGEHDAITPPAEMREMASKIPGAEMVMISGAGHMAPLEQSSDFNLALIEFLKRIDAA